jgi:hypothetical protein
MPSPKTHYPMTDKYLLRGMNPSNRKSLANGVIAEAQRSTGPLLKGNANQKRATDDFFQT